MFGIMKGVDRLDMEKMFPLETIDRGTVRITSKGQLALGLRIKVH